MRIKRRNYKINYMDGQYHSVKFGILEGINVKVYMDLFVQPDPSFLHPAVSVAVIFS